MSWGKGDDWEIIKVKNEPLTTDLSNITNGKARIIGDLSIHNSVDNPDCFCITHVPTLSNFMKAVPADYGEEYEDDELAKWCEKVQEQQQQFWAVLRELTPLTMHQNTDRDLKAKDRIKAWCLSVSIKEW